MKISTKGRYALRMMIEFAMNPERATKINQVAKNQQISEKYLEQIVSGLVKSGLVKSIRGAQGGYILSREPGEYSVGDILRATEGNLVPIYCLDSNTEPCWREGSCVTKNVFKQIADAVNQVVDNITLEDLLREEIAIRRSLSPDAPASFDAETNTPPLEKRDPSPSSLQTN